MNKTLTLNKTQSLGNVSNVHDYKLEDFWFKFKSINVKTGKIDFNAFHVDSISIMIIDGSDFYIGVDGMIKQAHTCDSQEQAFDIMDELEKAIGEENCVKAYSNGQVMLISSGMVSGLVLKETKSGDGVGVILGVKGIDQHKSDKTLTQYILFDSRDEAEEFIAKFW